jgi:hypothetical protein
VILDEAQVLVEQGVLAELRGLLNLEYEERRLLTLVLVGLPALARAVAEEPALADRVDVPLHIGALTNEESSRYLTHRIRAAGGNPAILESGAVAALVKWAGGSPRRLNGLADAALFEAHLAGRVSATAADVERAAAELELPAPEVSGATAAAAQAPLEPAGVPRAPVEVAPARRAAPPTRSLPPAPKLAAVRDLPAILDEAEVAIELEEVVATGTDPLRASAGATVALFGDASRLDAAFGVESEPDSTLALFAESDDFGSESPRLRHGEDSGAELDDLFADLVKD